MKHISSLMAAPVLLTLAACSSDSSYDFDGSKSELDALIAADSAPQALFSPDPETPVLPFPNSLFFLTSVDGTLDLPIAADDEQTLSNPRVALNQMDGYSTSSPISTTVSEALDPGSLTVGETLHVFEVSTAQYLAVTGILSELTSEQMVATSTGDQLVLIPTVPLNPKSDYLVVLTSGITDVDGNALEASLVYNLLKGDQELSGDASLALLEQLRGATGTHLVEAATQGIDSADIALSWVFRTQSTRDVLQATKDQSTQDGTLVLGNSGQTSPAGGKADVYIGSLRVPYYLTALSENTTPVDVMNSYWKNSDGNVVGTLDSSLTPNYAPLATSTQTIPVLMSVPNANSASGATMPANGWPVTIFQHGITRDRSDMLGIADAMADAGRVVIAIDMPLHGLIDSNNPLHADNTPFSEQERTFGIDLVRNPLDDGTAVLDTGPDGIPDTSGKYYFNLRNLANARDNLRQSIADLFVLKANLSSAQVEGLQLDASDLNFVGHSLGGIVGTSMLSFESGVHSATLAMPGGGIAQLLANSEAFSSVVSSGLQEMGIEPGSADYTSALIAAQTLLDSADPINHAATLAQSASTQLHMIEVLGDAVVPNSIATAPLSGTEPLARQLGLSQIVDTSTTGGLVKFSAGDHGSILNPATNTEATVEMQRQMSTFAFSKGGNLPINDSTVIAPLP